MLKLQSAENNFRKFWGAGLNAELLLMLNFWIAEFDHWKLLENFMMKVKGCANLSDENIKTNLLDLKPKLITDTSGSWMKRNEADVQDTVKMNKVTWDKYELRKQIGLLNDTVENRSHKMEKRS